MHAWAEVCHLLQSSNSPLTGFLYSIGSRITDQTRLSSITPRTPTVFLIQQSWVIITFHCVHVRKWDHSIPAWTWIITWISYFNSYIPNLVPSQTWLTIFLSINNSSQEVRAYPLWKPWTTIRPWLWQIVPEHSWWGTHQHDIPISWATQYHSQWNLRRSL